MSKTSYTILISDTGSHDTGIRGTRAFWWMADRIGAYAELGLYWFLSEYFGRSSVTLIRPSQLLTSPSKYKTDWLFVGLPTSLSKKHLKRIDFRRLVLYDSSDFNGVNFNYSDKSLLLSETNLCLKNWRDKRWGFDYSIGLLPIKRPPLNNWLPLAIRVASVKDRLGFLHKKCYDIGFVGRPSGDYAGNQRLRWLMDLKTHRPNLKFWGGLVGDKSRRKTLEQLWDAKVLDSCWLSRRRIGFLQYFSGLLRSKVTLAPAGYAPWTYRHYEAIYARSVVVSNDLSCYEFLVPLPREGIIEVSEGESVVRGVDAALALCESSPEILNANIEYLKRWLDMGTYSRGKRDTLDRFFAELDGY